MVAKIGLSGGMLGAVAGCVVLVAGIALWQGLEMRPGAAVELPGPQATQTPPATETAMVSGATQSESQGAGPAAVTPPDGLAAPVPPRFDTFRLSDDGTAVIAGTAPEATEVVVLLDAEPASRVAVGGNGGFAVVFDLAPAPLARSLSLLARYADGTERASGERLLVAPVLPRVAELAQDPSPLPTADLAPPLPGPATVAEVQGSASPPVQPANLLLSEAGIRVIRPPENAALQIDSIAYSGAGDVEVSGRGGVGGQVRLYLDNAVQMDVAVDEAGDWHATLPPVAPGLYTLRADLVGGEGRVDARSETPFLREAPSLLGGAQTGVITVQPGYTLWGIAHDAYGEGLLYVKVLEANRDQIRNPDLIYPGQVFALPGRD